MGLTLSSIVSSFPCASPTAALCVYSSSSGFLCLTSPPVQPHTLGRKTADIPSGFFCLPLHSLFSKTLGDAAEDVHPDKGAPGATEAAAAWLRTSRASHTHPSDTSRLELDTFVFSLSLPGREIFTIKCDFSCQLTHVRREF